MIMFGPDCGKPPPGWKPPPPPPHSSLRSRLGDAARVEVARAADPSDPTLSLWVKSQHTGSGVKFRGTPCSFPGRVWKSSVGPYWNMVCALNGVAPWARYTSADASLMTWKLADPSFTYTANGTLPDDKFGNNAAGPMFHEIPNPKARFPTHIINVGGGERFMLGTYDNKTERLLLNDSIGQQILQSPGTVGSFHWGAMGNAADGRLLLVAWTQSVDPLFPGGWDQNASISMPCEHGVRGGFGGCAKSVASLVREVHFDHASEQLVSYPIAEYTRLHNASFAKDLAMALPAGSFRTLPVPPAAGGAIDVLVSFDVSATEGTGGFGVSVRAPLGTISGGVAVSFNISAPNADGTRIATVVDPAHPLNPAPPPTPPLLEFMNGTDIGGGDYNTTHLGVGADAHVCQTLCLADLRCAAWTYVVRGTPTGSGDCIFKNVRHGCPGRTKGCTSGLGHGPKTRSCANPTPPGPRLIMQPVMVLRGETLDVRVLVDRPVVEIFVQHGRAAYTHAVTDFVPEKTAVHLFNEGGAVVVASNVTIWGVGCGWTAQRPASLKIDDSSVVSAASLCSSIYSEVQHRSST